MENKGHLERCSPKAVGIGCLISLKLFFKGFSAASPWLAGALMGFAVQFILISGMFSIFLDFEKIFSAQFIEGVFLLTSLTSLVTYFLGAVNENISFESPSGLVLWAAFSLLFGAFIFAAILVGLSAIFSVIYVLVKFSLLFFEPIQWLMDHGFFPEFELVRKSFPAIFYLGVTIIFSGYFMMRALLLIWCEIGQRHIQASKI